MLGIFDHIKEWWPQLLFVVAALIGTLRFLFAHGKKHSEIDRRLKWGKERFDKNDADHAAIKEQLEESDKKLDSAVVGLKELLVHNKLREPGQGINGES